MREWPGDADLDDGGHKVGGSVQLVFMEVEVAQVTRSGHLAHQLGSLSDRAKREEILDLEIHAGRSWYRGEHRDGDDGDQFRHVVDRPGRDPARIYVGT